jgi:hypothetical protein
MRSKYLYISLKQFIYLAAPHENDVTDATNVVSFDSPLFAYPQMYFLFNSLPAKFDGV